MQRTFSTKVRLLLVSVVFAIIACILLGRSIYLATSGAHRGRTNLMLMTRTPQSLKLLEAQNRKIAQIASDIDSYSLREIKDVLSQTSRVAGRTTTELRAQSDAWEKIKTKIDIDANTYKDVQQNLSLVARLQSAEIVKLNKLLDDSTKPTLWNNILALLSSFLLGIVSSVAATMAYDKYKTWDEKRRAHV